MLLTFVLLLVCVSLILLGAAAGKPLGWIALGLALLALGFWFFGPGAAPFR